jgi:hypothetical protein
VSDRGSFLWRYALAEGLVSDEKEDEDVRALTHKLTPGLAFYAVAIGRWIRHTRKER